MYLFSLETNLSKNATNITTWELFFSTPVQKQLRKKTRKSPQRNIGNKKTVRDAVGRNLSPDFCLQFSIHKYSQY